MLKERYLTKNILEDLNSKMVFVGGARQVGKTTLAKEIISREFKNFNYYNWDYKPDRQKLMKMELPGEDSLLIFDEIHKLKKWKPLIKGIFDKGIKKYKIIVTGSARMNIYRKGGDSLQGRYHYFTLFPFSLTELLNIKNKFYPLKNLNFKDENNSNYLDVLFKFGGFPEVIIKQNTRSLRRWHNEKLERLFREEIRDVESIRDISSMKLLGDMLPDKVGARLSINSIREDLEISHRAVTKWLDILEYFYYHFRIYPYTSRKIRGLKKDSKLYLLDWSEVENKGARFENLIATHLKKFVQYIYEYEGYKIDLYYLRNVDQKEIDFLVTFNNDPWFAVEVKLNDTNLSKNLNYFRERLNIPFVYQVVKKENVDFIKNNTRVISASKFLSGLV